MTSEAEERRANSQRAAERDAELVHRFNGGDESAFVEIVKLYRAKIFSIALYHLRNYADAEDIAQDTLIRAHRGLAKFRGDSSLATWMHRIAFNLSRNRWKHFQTRGRDVTMSLNCTLGADNAATLSDVIPSGTPSPAREAAVHEYSDLVAANMAKLDADQIEILRMRISLDWSYEEIADSLQVKVGTVKSRIGRARKRLRSLVAERYPNIPRGSTLLDWFDPLRHGESEPSPI